MQRHAVLKSSSISLRSCPLSLRERDGVRAGAVKDKDFSRALSTSKFASDAQLRRIATSKLSVEC
jgi:hypothetical protein